MYIEPSVTISPAANGGFIVTCREEEEMPKGKKMEPMGMCHKDINYVAEDINSVISILKEKLPKYAKEIIKDAKRTAMG